VIVDRQQGSPACLVETKVADRELDAGQLIGMIDLTRLMQIHSDANLRDVRDPHRLLAVHRMETVGTILVARKEMMTAECCPSWWTMFQSPYCTNLENQVTLSMQGSVNRGKPRSVVVVGGGKYSKYRSTMHSRGEVHVSRIRVAYVFAALAVFEKIVSSESACSKL
jgi:hypothetical protein